jgi:xanthine dehydrogenase YagS FAD-binding subunit
LKEALAQLSQQWGEADVLAGGTDLLNLMKEHIHSPKRVVNIKGIKELQGITAGASGLRVGATATIEDLMENKASAPPIQPAPGGGGITSPQIRHMGTVGGDLCQRPRCWYFRQGHGLLALNESGESLVPNGQNEFHAIFPQGKAYFVSPSSFGPALIALGAKVKVQSASGPREVPLEQWFLAPQTATEREVALKPNEIVTEILVPATKTKNATYEVRYREAVADWPSGDGIGGIDDERQHRAGRQVVWSRGAAPIVSAAAAAALKGKTLTPEAEARCKAAVADAKPLKTTPTRCSWQRRREARPAAGHRSGGIAMERAGLTDLSEERCETSAGRACGFKPSGIRRAPCKTGCSGAIARNSA